MSKTTNGIEHWLLTLATHYRYAHAAEWSYSNVLLEGSVADFLLSADFKKLNVDNTAVVISALPLADDEFDQLKASRDFYVYGVKR